MSMTNVAILGAGMTDMSRRDLTLDTMAYEVALEALGDAGVSPDELGLVVLGNAMAGRLSDQGCMRGQSWLRKAGFSEAAIVNVDNSCAGGSSALHLATMAATVGDRPVLALGVEKMLTGNRGETIAGIEDGLPAEYRHDLHARGARSPQPGRQHPHGPQRRLGPTADVRDGHDASPGRLRRRQGLRPCIEESLGPVPAEGHRRRGLGVPPGGGRPEAPDVQLVH